MPRCATWRRSRAGSHLVFTYIHRGRARRQRRVRGRRASARDAGARRRAVDVRLRSGRAAGATSRPAASRWSTTSARASTAPAIWARPAAAARVYRAVTARIDPARGDACRKWSAAQPGRRGAEQILDAAVACFAREGFHRTTMQDIVREAALSPGAIYGYFASKEAIIDAIGADRHALETALIAAASAAGDVPQVLRRLAREFFAMLRDPAERRRRRVGGADLGGGAAQSAPAAPGARRGGSSTRAARRSDPRRAGARRRVGRGRAGRGGAGDDRALSGLHPAAGLGPARRGAAVSVRSRSRDRRARPAPPAGGRRGREREHSDEWESERDAHRLDRHRRHGRLDVRPSARRGLSRHGLHPHAARAPSALLARGAAWADSPRAVAAGGDVVFTMVGFPHDVREVVLGPDGVLAGAARRRRARRHDDERAGAGARDRRGGAGARRRQPRRAGLGRRRRRARGAPLDHGRRRPAAFARRAAAVRAAWARPSCARGRPAPASTPRWSTRS